MREIKFRGKCKDDGKFYFGNLVKICGDSFIIAPSTWEYKNVDPLHWKIMEYEGCRYAVVVYSVYNKTVVQFTGFKDIDDKEIFEGDIIQNDEYSEDIGKIINENGCWLVDWVDYDSKPCLGWLLDNTPQRVIGNIFDNPELLEMDENG